MCYLDIEGSIEAHLQVPLFIFVEDAQETLLENGSGERVGKNHDTIRSVW